jgi:hypothetical protein
VLWILLAVVFCGGYGPERRKPLGVDIEVTAIMEPSCPAAYCRTEREPLGGGGPGLYVDFSMFCFQVPMIGSE